MLIAAGVLNRALKKLVTIVPKRSTLPVLGNFKIEPASGGVAIVATDLTTEARVVVPATDAFALCLPARSLSEFVLDRSPHDVAEALEAVASGVELIHVAVGHPRPTRLVGRHRSWKCKSCGYRRRCAEDRS